jgi:DnaJ domain
MSLEEVSQHRIKVFPHLGEFLNFFLGLLMGVSQVVRGAINTPNAIIAPRQGKWWNDNEGKWIKTNLQEEQKWLSKQPSDNDDILGPIRAVFQSQFMDANSSLHDNDDCPVVKDSYYYNLLQVPTSADDSLIARQYYAMTRRYNPQRAGQSDEATHILQEIGTAYVVLTHPDFRQRYNQYGKDFMNYDDDSEEGDYKEAPEQKNIVPLVDPMVLYSVLFGSDKFQDYIGCLAAATSASVGETSSITKVQARLLQRRRVTKLAMHLAARLQDYVEDKALIAKANWKTEAEYLTQASYGTELTNTIGKVRNKAL